MMAHDTRHKPGRDPGRPAPSAILIDRHVDIFRHTQSTAHITAEAAHTVQEVARFRHAVPAQERTARAKERSYRHYVTVSGAVVVGGLACAFLCGTSLATVLVSVVGFVTVDSVVGQVASKKDEKF
jgi:hypothetical protein